MIRHRRLKRAGLAITAASCVTTGLAILTADDDVTASRPIRRAALMESLQAVEAFAWVFILIGFLCAAAVLHRRLHPLAFGMASAAHLLWGLSYLGGWIWFRADIPRGWVTACLFLTIAAAVVVVSGIREEMVTWEPRSSSP